MIRYATTSQVTDSDVDELLTWTDNSRASIRYVLETDCWSVHSREWRKAPLIIFADGSLIIGIWFHPYGIENADGTTTVYPRGYRETGLEWKWTRSDSHHRLLRLSRGKAHDILNSRGELSLPSTSQAPYFTFEVWGNDYSSDGASTWISGASVKIAPVFGGDLPEPVISELARHSVGI